MPRLFRDKKSKCWYIDYTVNGRRVRKSLGTKDRRLAELKLKEIEVDLAKKRLGFGESIDKWEFYRIYIDWCKANKAYNTAKKDKFVLKEFFEWVPVSKLDKISRKHLESYKTYLISHRKLSKSSVNLHLRHIKAAFSYAVRWEYLQSSPADRVTFFSLPEKGKLRILTEEEEEQIIEYFRNCRSKHKDILIAAFRILLYTGMRIGELRALEWEDVDLENRLIRIATKDSWHSKTKRNRVIPIPSIIIEDFKTLKRLSPNKPYTFYEYHMTHAIKRACEALCLEPASAHTLRHTYASRLAMQGVSIYTISKLLGHSSVATTQIYAKFLPDRLIDVVEEAFANGRKSAESDASKILAS